MRHDFSLRREVGRVTAGARRKLQDVIRDHALQPGRSLASCKLHNPKPVFFSKGSGFSRSPIVFSKHYVYYMRPPRVLLKPQCKVFVYNDER